MFFLVAIFCIIIGEFAEQVQFHYMFFSLVPMGWNVQRLEWVTSQTQWENVLNSSEKFLFNSSRQPQISLVTHNIFPEHWQICALSHNVPI